MNRHGWYRKEQVFSLDEEQMNMHGWFKMPSQKKEMEATLIEHLHAPTNAKSN